MLKVLNILKKQNKINLIQFNTFFKVNVRTFLSQAYYCQEVWERRLTNPLFQKINLDELYYDLEQRFLKTRQISAVDVDIFANAVQDNTFIDELLDLVHKLRLTADTTNTLNSTSHAVVRAILQYGKSEELVDALDDRLNYGLFLDYYTANLLLDTFWKSKDYTLGARVASQMMLQEEFDHPVTSSLSLLHCNNYLLKPENWPEYKKPEEPEEEVKIRVKYLRNPYDDDHFDLKDPNKIVGKTLAMTTKGKSDLLNRSFNILGLALYEKHDMVESVIKECKNNKIGVYKEVLELIPANNKSKKLVSEVKTESANIANLLTSNVEKATQETSEKDIAEQCKIFSKWDEERKEALENQRQRLLTAKRLTDIEDLKKAIKLKETKLWFFENEEQIELGIEAKKVYYPKRWFGKKKKPKKIDEGYVPPEVQSKQTNPHQY